MCLQLYRLVQPTIRQGGRGIMVHPTTFILQKIAGYQTNGHEKLGHLKAEFIDDISAIMREFAEDTAIEVAQRLARGESVMLKGNVYCLKKIKAKKQNATR